MLTCSGLRFTVLETDDGSELESLNKETIDGVHSMALERRRRLLHVFTPRKKNLNFIGAERKIWLNKVLKK